MGKEARFSSNLRDRERHGGVVKFAARISPLLRAEIERLAEGTQSAAEITRLVGATAERLGQTRPSYERIRTIVVNIRRGPRGPSTGDVLLEVAFRVRPPHAVLQHLAGVDRPVRRK